MRGCVLKSIRGRKYSLFLLQDDPTNSFVGLIPRGAYESSCSLNTPACFKREKEWLPDKLRGKHLASRLGSIEVAGKEEGEGEGARLLIVLPNRYND